MFAVQKTSWAISIFGSKLRSKPRIKLFRRAMATVDPGTFYCQNAIIPPPAGLKLKSRRVRVMMDSRLRDRSKFPKSSDFELQLDNELNNVTSLALLSYNVPKQIYTVNESNNMLWFTEELLMFDPVTGAMRALDPAQVRSVTIEPGAYSPQDLADTLRASLNGATRATIGVSYNSITCKYVFSSSLFDPATNKYVSFSILNQFGETVKNSIAQCIGLSPAKNYYGAFEKPVRPASAVVYTEEAVGVKQGQRIIVGDVVSAPQLYNIVSVQPAYPKYIVLNGSHASTSAPVSLNHGTIQSETHSILDIPEDYYILEIDRFKGDIHPRSHAVNNAFAILHPAGTIQVDENRYTKTLTPPINGVKSLRVKLRNYDGTLCNFENREVFIELLITQDTCDRARAF